MSVRRVSGPGVKVETALRELDGFVGKTGWLNAQPHPDTGESPAYIATIHEFGSPEQNIPPRPTMRPAAAKNEQKWAATMGRGARAVLRGETAPATVLELVALEAAEDVRNEINSLTSPPLKPATIERKGFSKPLIDTGHMFKTITGIAEPKA